MVRSRIGSDPARLLAADTDALTGTDRRGIGAWRDATAPIEASERGAFRFLFEIALPWIGRRARSIALGCVVALGGCGDPDCVEVAGVVRDGRTGAPIAHAQITTDDGRTLQTDDDGRFTAFAAESLTASAEGRCDARARVARSGPRELTLRLFDRLEVPRERAQVGFDAEVRLEVRTRCDAGAELSWTQIAGPVLGERMRVEDNGRVLVVRTHPQRLSSAQRQYRFAVGGDLGGERVVREVQLVAGPAGVASERRRIGRPRGGRAELASGGRSRVDRPRLGPAGTYLLERVRDDEGWTHTAHALRRGLGDARGAGDPRCWSCHAPGLERGAGWDPPDAGAPEHAPPQLRRGASWCSTCHAGPVAGSSHGVQRAGFQVDVCARCHDGGELANPGHVSLELDEWRLTGMSELVRDPREDDPALRGECAQCHSAQGFAAWQRGQPHEPDRATAEPITCAACHDPHDASRPHALRVFDRVDAIGGAPADHLGSGALCASCHRGGVARSDEPDRAAHAPQSDVLIGRGARLAQPLDGGAHRFIANTCVRCHMTPARDALRGRAGGHTFSIRARIGEPVISKAACAPCHGASVSPEAIGARDWDGDGASGDIADEHERALAAVSERLRARIARASITDACGRAAAGVVDHDARLHLVDARGVLLGDCDESGRIESGEAAVTVSALPRALADAAHDIALLRADGSRGVHNPAYAFRVLAALDRALR